MFNKTKNKINYKRERLVRVIVKYKNGNFATGTGFFINNKGLLLTCFHVISGAILKEIRSKKLLSSFEGENEHAKLQNYFPSIIKTIEIEFFDGSKKTAKLLKFNEKYDIASLQLEENSKVLFFNVDTKYVPKHDESVFFCGFQQAADYSAENYPFATNRGIVSSFLDIAVGGDKYSHTQLNSINLGGNSGAPLFCESKNTVIGVVNGNMNWGSDNIGFVQKTKNEDKVVSGTFRTPLSIAYTTSLKLIKEMTDVLDDSIV